MPTPDLAALVDIVIAHKWWAVASVAIGALVRYTKSDTPGPVLPARYRPALALGLGVLSACLERIAAGAPWEYTLAGGLVSAAVAVLGHGVIVDGVRGGAELPVPGVRDMAPFALLVVAAYLGAGLACGPTHTAPVPYPARVVVEGLACEAAAAQLPVDDATEAALVAACKAAAVVYGRRITMPRATDAGAE